MTIDPKNTKFSAVWLEGVWRILDSYANPRLRLGSFEIIGSRNAFGRRAPSFTAKLNKKNYTTYTHLYPLIPTFLFIWNTMQNKSIIQIIIY